MACEKCWSDAGVAAALRGGCRMGHYHRLLKEREDNPCTIEEQCGELHVVQHYTDGSRRCMCGKVKGGAG